MDALIRSILEKVSISDLENLIEEKRKMLSPKKADENDMIKAYLIKNHLKYRNPKILQTNKN